MIMSNQTRDVWIVDTTLRDGEQAPGVVFSAPEKRAIAQLLDMAGVPEIEVGTPAMGERERETIRSLVHMQLNARLTSWCRSLKKDIDWARACLTPGVHISFPASNILLDVFNLNKEIILAETEELVRYAHQYFDYVSVGVQDVARADIDFIKTFARIAFEAGAFRIRLADTVGLMNPMQVFEMIQQLKDASDIDIEFHGHNDLGMATANSLAAVAGGAACVSTTVNGLGERAGNAAFEEVVMALDKSMKMHCGIQSELFNKLTTYVSEYSHTPITDRKPVVGRNIFLHESGIHVRGLSVNPQSYEPFNAESVGKPSEDFVIGKHSGLHSIMNYFLKKDTCIDRGHGYKILCRVKSFSHENKRNVTDDELRRFYLDTLETVLAVY